MIVNFSQSGLEFESHPPCLAVSVLISDEANSLKVQTLVFAEYTGIKYMGIHD